MSSFQNLPPEIIAYILGLKQKDKRLLYHTSLTCRALQTQAEILLYSHIVFGKRQFDTLALFARTVLDNPRLGLLVRSYTGPVLATSIPSSNIPQPSSIQNQQGRSDSWFAKLVNLEELDIVSTSPGSLPSCGSTRLIKVDLIGMFTFSEVEQLLTNQTELTELSIVMDAALSYDSDPTPFSPLACPNLQLFKGGMNGAQALFPGRHLRRFWWGYTPGQLHDDFQLLGRIAPQLAQLRSLTYVPENHFHIHPLYHLPDYLPSLRFLELRRIFPEDWLAIPKFPQLIALLVLEPQKLMKGVMHESERVLELFTKCPLLERVDIGARDHRVVKACYRFRRGVEKPEVISLLAAEHGRKEFINDD
ncbi:hypothetical protein CPB84DRAFT_1753227 [Gymnopilus junonius]|uniref:Uncharacterized protein n=1 Tax=Gymnopilus junonius TaxID=109634 RepID=A0A9P5TF98_GYMJU|nr:hypothetical protein CPB84DRAFT_1753227 [Gymnopilus junonius]